MTDYSAFAPARPPQSPTDPASPSPSSSHFALAPSFSNLQIDQSYQNQNQHAPYRQQQLGYSREQPSYQQGGPPQLANLNIPSAQMHNDAGSRSPASPGGAGGYGYSSANRPRPNFNAGGPPISPVGSAGRVGGGGGAPNGDSPTRVPRKSSLAATNSGISPSNSHERLPPLPTSSSSMHFPKTFGDEEHASSDNQRDSHGGEAVFNGAALASGSANSQSYSSPPPSASLPPPVRVPPPAKKANPLEDLIATETLYVEDLGAVIKVSHLELFAFAPLPTLADARVLHRLDTARRSSLVTVKLPSSSARHNVQGSRSRLPNQQNPSRREFLLYSDSVAKAELTFCPIEIERDRTEPFFTKSPR